MSYFTSQQVSNIYEVFHNKLLFIGILEDTCTDDCKLTLCSSYGIFVLVFITTYTGLIYYKILKPRWGNKIYQTAVSPLKKAIKQTIKKK